MTHREPMDALVVGEALIDIVQKEDQRTEHVGGSPANVALGLGRRGADVALLTHLADDRHGRMVLEHLAASGVRVLAESITETTTSTAVATIAPDGHADYVFDVAWDLPDVANLAPRLVHTGSVAAFIEPGGGRVRDLLRTTTAADVTFDPNIRPALLPSREIALTMFEATARMSTVVKLSDEDAAWLYPGASPDQVLDTVLGLGPRLVAITLGADGAVIVNSSHRVWIGAPTVSVVDTIGAGDTFMASLIHSVLEGGSADLTRADLERVLRDAVAAAAITVTRSGADLPWAHELGR